MSFHRFLDPNYLGAPTLPTGPTPVTFDGTSYNRINVNSGGTGGSGSAYADSSKGFGPNAGSYFVAYGEDASSSNANRGLRALAENTDHLDDLFHRPLATPVRTATATASGAVSSIILPTGTFLSFSFSAALGDLFSILDDNDNEIIEQATGTKVVVNGILSGEGVGTGFSTGAVTLSVSPSIPNGTNYRVYYAERSNLANLPVDALTFARIRGAEEVSAEVEDMFRKMQAPSAQLIAWNANPSTTLYEAARGGLDERYRRGSSLAGSVPSEHPLSITLNQAGSGAWYVRDSIGMTGFAQQVSASVTGQQGLQEYNFGGIWVSRHNDRYTATTAQHRQATTSGFVFLGQRQPNASTGNTTRSPGLFSFMHASSRALTAVGSGSLTDIATGGTVTLSGDQITLTGGQVFYTNSSGNKSGFALGTDILVLTIGGAQHQVTVTSLSSATVGTVRYLDGSTPNLSGAATITSWRSPIFYVSDGATEWFENKTSGSSPVKLRGLFYASPPSNKRLVDAQIPEQPARVFGGLNTKTNTALAWGGYSDATNAYAEGGYLRGDGSIDSMQMRPVGVAPTVFTQTGAVISGTVYYTMNARTDGQILRCEQNALNVDVTISMVRSGMELMIYIPSNASTAKTLEVHATDEAGLVITSHFINAGDTSADATGALTNNDPSTYLFRGVYIQGPGGTRFLIWKKYRIGAV